MNCRELFINTDNVLIVRKELACIIGLNEAIVLNQIDYWIDKFSNDEEHIKDGCVWVYNTYEDWNKDNFPFWCVDTIKRTIKSLKNKNLIKTGNYNRLKLDRTVWYTIDYEELQKQCDEYEKCNMQQSIVAKCTNGKVQNAPTNTIDYNHRIQTENTANSFSNEKESKFSQAINHGLTDNSLDCVEKKTISRVIEYCRSIHDDDIIVNNVVDTFEYYFEKYHEYKKDGHPIVSDESIRKIVSLLVYGIEDTEDMIYSSGNSSYRAMIDEHFRTRYKKRTDYHIQHFATEGIFENLFYHVLY